MDSDKAWTKIVEDVLHIEMKRKNIRSEEEEEEEENPAPFSRPAQRVNIGPSVLLSMPPEMIQRTLRAMPAREVFELYQVGSFVLNSHLDSWWANLISRYGLSQNERAAYLMLAMSPRWKLELGTVTLEERFVLTFYKLYQGDTMPLFDEYAERILKGTQHTLNDVYAIRSRLLGTSRIDWPLFSRLPGRILATAFCTVNGNSDMCRLDGTDLQVRIYFFFFPNEFPFPEIREISRPSWQHFNFIATFDRFDGYEAVWRAQIEPYINNARADKRRTLVPTYMEDSYIIRREIPDYRIPGIRRILRLKNYLTVIFYLRSDK